MRIVRACTFALLGCALSVFVSACSGGNPNTPNGSVVNNPGSGNPPMNLITAQVTITIPGSTTNARKLRPQYLSTGTQSVAIALASVNGNAATGVNASTINTAPKAPNCSVDGSNTVCSGTVQAAPGNDIFTVTTYEWQNATGAILSVGTVRATISANGGGVTINKGLSLALEGIVASLVLRFPHDTVDRGKAATVPVDLEALDAAGAQIVGPSLFQSPIGLTIQGDSQNAFTLHSGSTHGTSLTIAKPAGSLLVSYDGNENVAPITLQATVSGPNTVSAQATLNIHGSPPPPPGGSLYVLNAGTKQGLGATVTVYGTTANGNAAPVRTLQLSSSLYATSIALDAKNDLYVGYVQMPPGYTTPNGVPYSGNEIAEYAPGASGNAQPTRTIQADQSTQTTLVPLAMAFDKAGDLITYGATTVDGSNTAGAVLTYAPTSSGAVAPAHAWNFAPPPITFSGPTGLAIDANDNFYVSVFRKAAVNSIGGIFVVPPSDRDNPSVSPARTIQWNGTTQLFQNQVSNIALDQAGEIYVANFAVISGSPPLCTPQVTVFAAGAGGGSTNVPPLRVLSLNGIASANEPCLSASNPLTPFFPSIAVYKSSIFVADDFSNTIGVFSTQASGNVTPSQTLSGSATGLNVPISIAVSSASASTQVSGRISVRPDLGGARLPSTSPRPLVH